MTTEGHPTATEGHPQEAQVVRWRRSAGARWSYGRWSGVYGPDGSLTTWEAESLAAARAGGSGLRSRALRPELVEVNDKGNRWSPLVTNDEHEDIADVASASLVDGDAREGVELAECATCGELVEAGDPDHAHDDEGFCFVCGRRDEHSPGCPHIAPPEVPSSREGVACEIHRPMTEGSGPGAMETVCANCGETLRSDHVSPELLDKLDTALERFVDAVEALAGPPLVDPLTFCLRELVAYASVMMWSGWSPEPSGTASGAELVAALEAARNGVRAQFPELLDAVMITGSGLNSYGVTWGHFRREAWRDALASGRRPEIFVGAERLATGAVLTMQTILHEAAHELAFVRDVQDTSRQHRYHNGKFRQIAEELGLSYVPDDPDATLGYSAVTLTAEGKRRWRDEIAALHAAVTLMGDDPTRWLTAGAGLGGLGGHGVRLPRMPGQPRKGGTSYVKAECACPRIIRVSASTLDMGAITCNICEEEFS